MVATPDVSEYPPLPTSALPTSLGHELTVETPSDLPETRLAETQTPGTPITPEKEKEKESDYAMEGTPPTSSPVQFIGINYIPPASRERETTSPLRSSGRDPTPWESGAASPLSEDYVMIGVSTFPPKPCVVFPVDFFLDIPSTHSRTQQRASEAWRRACFVVPVWACSRFGVLCATHGTHWGAPPARDRPCGTRLHWGRDCTVFICLSYGT